MTGMRISHLVLRVILLGYGSWRVHRVPLMRIRWGRGMIAMMLRLGNHWRCMVLVILMWRFRMIHRVPFDRPVLH